MKLAESLAAIGAATIVERAEERWVDEFKNLVVNDGLDDYLEQYYNGSTYTAAHFVGLTDDTPSFAAGDNNAGHAGWIEATPYSEGVRQTYSPAAVSGQSVTNTASKAVFSINATDTVGGAFLTTLNTKAGSVDLLVGGAAFTGGDRSVANGDTMNVTVVASLTSS